jgi:DNA-binding transcriptional LysR family regulator
LELREQVGGIVQAATSLLRPPQTLDLRQLVRTFTLRSSEGFVETFGPALIARIGEAAPGLRLRFLQKADRDSALLRDGTVDLETGVIGRTTGPEIRAQSLFRDRFIGVVRRGHKLSKGKVTPARYAAGQHVCVSRQVPARNAIGGPVDEALADALAPLGLKREIVTMVGGFAAALALARGSDLIATVPERHTAGLRGDLHSFSLPVAAPEITVSLLWHPRLDADPAHRWLRGCVRGICADHQVAEPDSAAQDA